MNEEESRVVDLKLQVARNDSTVDLVDIPSIEQGERKRLATAHLKKAEKSTRIIADMIYCKLEELVDTLLGSIGVANPDGDLFDLEAIVPRSICHAQIEALVMRVAFPVGVAYIRWGKRHENRPHAFEELKAVCPEVIFSSQDLNN